MTGAVLDSSEIDSNAEEDEPHEYCDEDEGDDEEEVGG